MRVKDVANLKVGDLVVYQTARMADEDGGEVVDVTSCTAILRNGNEITNQDFVNLRFRVCPECGTKFEPNFEEQTYDNRKCGALAGVKKRKPLLPKPRKHSRLAWYLAKRKLDVCGKKNFKATFDRLKVDWPTVSFPSYDAVRSALASHGPGLGIEKAQFAAADEFDMSWVGVDGRFKALEKKPAQAAEPVATNTKGETATDIDYGTTVVLGITREEFLKDVDLSIPYKHEHQGHGQVMKRAADALCELLDDIRGAMDVEARCVRVLMALEETDGGE